MCVLCVYVCAKVCLHVHDCVHTGKCSNIILPFSSKRVPYVHLKVSENTPYLYNLCNCIMQMIMESDHTRIVKTQPSLQ